MAGLGAANSLDMRVKVSSNYLRWLHANDASTNVVVSMLTQQHHLECRKKKL
jgi:hypothetical protein